MRRREEHSSGGTRVTVKVYNQEKTSSEQTQRVQHKVRIRTDKKKKHLKKPDHFCKSIRWTTVFNINLYQNNGSKISMEKAWNSS